MIINLMKIGTVEHILYLRVYISILYKLIAWFEWSQYKRSEYILWGIRELQESGKATVFLWA